MRGLAAALLILALAVPAFATSPILSNVGPRHGGSAPPELGLAPDLVFPCVETCRPGDIDENEPDCYDCYYDYTNGGCNSTGWTELYPQGSDGVSHACGTSGSFWCGYYSYRDTDWFSARAGNQSTTTETVTAEFGDLTPILVYASSGTISCDNYTYIYTWGYACSPASISAPIPSWSTFWPWVGSQDFGCCVPCGSHYRLDVSNTWYPITGTERFTWGTVESSVPLTKEG